MKTVWLFLMFLLSFSSCKKAETSLESNSVDQVKFVKPVIAKAEEEVSISDEKVENITDSKFEQKIINEANIKFETNDLEATNNQIQKNILESGATIQNDTEGKDSESIFRKLIVRIPSQNFDVFIKSISKDVGYFDNKEISSQDVTAEYIDIDARLKAKKVLESRYLELLKKANKVSEMLEIEKQISVIREEIEAKQGQLQYMQNRVSMSTITIEFYKAVIEKSAVRASYGTKIWSAITSGFNGLSSLFIGLLSIWPFLIITITVSYFIKKRFKKKTT